MLFFARPFDVTEPSAASAISLPGLENNFAKGLVKGPTGMLCNEVETKIETSKKLMMRSFIIYYISEKPQSIKYS